MSSDKDLDGVTLDLGELNLVLMCSGCLEQQLRGVVRYYTNKPHNFGVIVDVDACEECTNQLVWNLTDVDEG